MTRKKTELPRGIRERSGKFFVDVTVKGQRKTATCDSLAEAVETKAHLKEALEAGKEVNTRRSNAVSWTLQQAADKTLSLPKPRGWKGTSYEKQAALNIKDAIKFFGPDRQLATLTLQEVDNWLDDCERRGNSSSTCNRKLSALSKVTKVALAYDGLEAPLKLPLQRVEPVGRIRQISAQEEEQLLAYLRTLGKDEMADAVAVLIDTGMRRGELLQVRPTDVSHETGVIMVYGVEGKGTKNGKFRSVPMTKRVAEIMSKRTLGKTCFDLSVSEMRHSWDAARAHLGLTEDKDFTLHVCRHTTASRLVQKGVSVPVVKDWLGHSHISTTMRYAHLYPRDLMNAVKALEA
jgi:integrase